jgi:uncharacterized protein
MSADLDRPPSFLGTGWAFPPAFGPGGQEVAMVVGAQDIEQSLAVLFSTRPGERPMQEGYGCALDELVFEEMDHACINGLASRIHDAVLYHEPRIEPLGVEVEPDPNLAQDGLLLIRFDYRVLETNSRYNMVFPFYLNEATAPGP